MYMRRAERPEAKARKKPSCNNLIFFSFYFEIIKFELKKNKEGKGKPKTKAKWRRNRSLYFFYSTAPRSKIMDVFVPQLVHYF
jgi:hypothetical protein